MSRRQPRNFVRLQIPVVATIEIGIRYFTPGTGQRVFLQHPSTSLLSGCIGRVVFDAVPLLAVVDARVIGIPFVRTFDAVVQVDANIGCGERTCHRLETRESSIKVAT